MSTYSQQLDAATLENVAAYVHDIRITHLAMLATATFLVYDILLTFADEFKYIWKSRWSYAKAAFFLNRYLTIILFAYDLFVFFAVPTSVHFCKINGMIAAPASMPNMFLVSTIFMMRTYAIYEHSRRILIALIVTYMLCFVPALVYYYISTSHGLSAQAMATMMSIIKIKQVLLQHGVDLGQGWWSITTCTSIGVPEELGAVMLAALLYESGLMFAMVYKLHGEKRSRLINRLYFDGIAYYLLMLGTLIAATIGCYYSPTSRAVVASRYFVGMKSVLCSRMILRLRWYSSAQNPTFGGQEEALATGTDIYFAEAGPGSKEEWLKSEDFGIEVPPGTVLSRGASPDEFSAMAMVPMRTRIARGSVEDDLDLDLEAGHSVCSDCREERRQEGESSSSRTAIAPGDIEEQKGLQICLFVQRGEEEASSSCREVESTLLPPAG